MFQGASGFLGSMSDAELDSRLETLSVDLAIAGATIEPDVAVRKRARTLFRGIAVAVAGIVFAAQTGGLSLLVSIIGATDILDVLEEDVEAGTLQSRLRSDLDRYNGAFERIAAEKARRDWW